MESDLATSLEYDTFCQVAAEKQDKAKPENAKNACLITV